METPSAAPAKPLSFASVLSKTPVMKAHPEANKCEAVTKTADDDGKAVFSTKVRNTDYVFMMNCDSSIDWLKDHLTCTWLIDEPCSQYNVELSLSGTYKAALRCEIAS